MTDHFRPHRHEPPHPVPRQTRQIIAAAIAEVDLEDRTVDDANDAGILNGEDDHDV